MLKKQIKNKKGFTLIEILVAVTILAIIVGPLLASLFSNNRVIEQARKETEATYVAKKVMEETLSEYYISIANIKNPTTQTVNNGVEPTCIVELRELLSKNTSETIEYKSDENFHSKYADGFKYEIKIVPSGKNGIGEIDPDDIRANTSNYLHIYTDVVSGNVYNYAVFPDGTIQRVNAFSTSKVNEITLTNNYNKSFSMSVSGNTNQNITGRTLNEKKNSFVASCYSSKSSNKYQFKFAYNAAWPTSCKNSIINYTSKSDANQVTVTGNNVENYYSSSREQWDIALYEITVNVYGKSAYGAENVLLASTQSSIEAKIFLSNS